MRRKRLAAVLFALVFWLLVWFALSRGRAGLFLAGPEKVLRRLWELLGEAESWRRLLHSLGRVLFGFSAAFLLAPPLALLSRRSAVFRALVMLPLQCMKAVPLAALIILMIFWLPSSRLSPFVAFMPAFPLLFDALSSAFSSLDPKLGEMAQVYGLSKLRRLLRIDLPQLLPAYLAAAATALAFAFKAGIAAEVIGLPEASVGEALFDAKISWDSASLIAWVLLILALSALTTYSFRLLLCFRRKSPSGAQKESRQEQVLLDESSAALPALEDEDLAFLKKVLRPSQQGKLEARNLGLRFDGPWLFRHLDLQLGSGNRHLLSAPSGSGKTSLLRVLGGLEHATEGQAERLPLRPIAWLFQEDRLLEDRSGYQNLCLLLPRGKPEKEKAARLLLKLLGLESCAELRTAYYSAGMKRRLAFARALLVDSPLLFLDEPLAHLDKENRERIRRLTDALSEERILVMVSHRS